MFLSEVHVQCWGYWDEMEYRYVLLNKENEYPQFILVSILFNKILFDNFMCRKYIEMQTLADEKCFNKNNNNDVQLIYGQ